MGFAGLNPFGENIPIPWSQYKGRGGKNYSLVRAVEPYCGYEGNIPARVIDHPEPHPPQG